MANPTYQAQGASVSGSGAITVAWPTHVADDVALLFVESANQAVTLTTAAGFVEITNTGTGTAGVALATRLTVFWCRATSAAQASPVVGDSGTRQTGIILTFRGCITTGNPWDVFTSSVAAAATAAMSIPGPTTTVAETLLVAAMSNSLGVDAETIRPASLANTSLTNVALRLNTQEDGIGGGTATSDALPVGLSAFGSGGSFGEVGEGPGMDDAEPRCKVCLFVPNINTIGDIIDTADEHGVLLVLNVAGNKGSYTETIGGTPTLNMGFYQRNVERFRPGDSNTAFPDRAKFAEAVARRRIVFYVVDEPNLTNANNSNVPDITPTQANQMALIHKSIWPGCITILRCAANTLLSGWNGSSRPTGGYTGVDYCWLQYNNNHGKGGTSTWGTPLDPRDVWDEQRTIISENNMNMGLCVSLNLWAGGIGENFLGVAAKWDTDGPGGSSTLGYLLGDREGASTATVVTGTLSNTVRSVAANPDWIGKFTELAAADPDIPFVLFWQHVTSTSPSNDYLSYYTRADYESALDDAITTGLARTEFNGWRVSK